MWVRILMVPGAGIEPARLAARDFESRASTYSAISATHQEIMTGDGEECNIRRLSGRAGLLVVR